MRTIYSGHQRFASPCHAGTLRLQQTAVSHLKSCALCQSGQRGWTAETPFGSQGAVWLGSSLCRLHACWLCHLPPAQTITHDAVAKKGFGYSRVCFDKGVWHSKKVVPSCAGILATNSGSESTFAVQQVQEIGLDNLQRWGSIQCPTGISRLHQACKEFGSGLLLAKIKKA